MEKTYLKLSALIAIASFCASCAVGARTAQTGSTVAAGSTSSTSAISLASSEVSVAVNATYTFSASGGVSPYYYYLTSGAGTVDLKSGLYTAPATSGSAQVELMDSSGSSTYAQITITSGGTGSLTLYVYPAAITLTEGATYTFTASGGSGTYTYSVAGGIGSIGSSTGLFSAPQALGTSEIKVTDTSGNIAYATVTISDSSTTTSALGIGSFCGSYDIDHIAGVINNIGCNGVLLAGGKCPSGYIYKTYFQADGNYASTCVATTTQSVTPIGTFCGNYDVDHIAGVINNIPCNGANIAHGNCPSGYTYATYFQADSNSASTCVATSTGIPMLLQGSFCGNYDVDKVHGVINNILCNGVSLSGGSCPSGYTYATYFQADSNYASTCVMN